jgi:NAD(P) transhydrogenase subunit alpha
MLVTNLAILVLAGFVGFAVISKVPNTLHTPLMSGTNAIHGIVVLAGLLVVGFSGNDLFNKVILVIAIAFGTINVVGGFLVTDRMLGMFKRKPEPVKEVEAAPEPKPPGEPAAAPAAEVEESPAEAEVEPPPAAGTAEA